MKRSTINKNRMKNHEFVILEYIRDNPGGVTVSDIANFTKFSRNTVSKYVAVLEAKNQIFSKKVGAYKLYFTTKRSYIPLELAISYYKALISRFKKYIPETEGLAKKIGKEAVTDIKFSFGPSILKQMRSLKDNPISRVHLESFKNFYPVYDPFSPEIEITIVDIDPNGKSATFRFKNSPFLLNTNEFDYHIYIICGITEGILERELKTKVSCEVKKIQPSEKKDDAYFDIVVKLL
ncbi:MAG: MarR family transcriptional regulator [Candidatus Odinarchaeota archaeon]